MLLLKTIFQDNLKKTTIKQTLLPYLVTVMKNYFLFFTTKKLKRIVFYFFILDCFLRPILNNYTNIYNN